MGSLNSRQWLKQIPLQFFAQESKVLNESLRQVKVKLSSKVAVLQAATGDGFSLALCAGKPPAKLLQRAVEAPDDKKFDKFAASGCFFVSTKHPHCQKYIFSGLV